MTPGVRPLIAGNWKMHGSMREATSLALAVQEGRRAWGRSCWSARSSCTCRSWPACCRAVAIAVGAQDCHRAAKGAHTGDVAAAMLADAGARYVILGHSERRADHAETDAVVRAKAEAAVAAGLTPIVCVGETEAERWRARRRRWSAGSSLARSPMASARPGASWPMSRSGPSAPGARRPRPTSRRSTRRSAGALSARFGEAGARARILYGGSVKPGNAAEILALPHVDGALVGGASLVAADFLAIARAAQA
jgi:triosephosphate isomerase